MQADCNLVLYDVVEGNRVVWASDSGTSHAKPKLQLGADGNLAVFDGSYQRWSSNTGGQGDESSVLQVQDDGDVVILSKGGQIWHTDTKQREKTNHINAGEALRKDEALTSTNEKFRFVMQGDGNLVLYDLREGSKSIWASESHVYRGRPKATLQTDGNLVVSDGKDTSKWGPEWQSNSKGGDDAVLTMQDDGNAVITSGGQQIWETGTNGPRPTTSTPERVSGKTRASCPQTTGSGL